MFSSRRHLVVTHVLPIAVLVAGMLLASATPSARQAPAPSAEALLEAARAAVGIRPGGPTVSSLRLVGTRVSTQGIRADCREGTVRAATNETPLEIRVQPPDRFVWIENGSRRGFIGGSAFFGRNGEDVSPTPDLLPSLRSRSFRIVLGMIARPDILTDASVTVAGPNTLHVEAGPEGFYHVLDTLELDPITRAPVRLMRRERTTVREPGAILKRFDPGDPSCGGGGVGRVDSLPEQTVTMSFEDRREVDGVMVPFRITTSARGVVLQQLHFDTIEVNPRLTDEDF